MCLYGIPALLWKLEQITDTKGLTSQVATEVSKSLSAELLMAVRTESHESLLSSNDNEQYHRMTNVRFHGIQPDKDCRSLAVDFIKNVLHVRDIEEKDIEAAHSAEMARQQLVVAAEIQAAAQCLLIAADDSEMMECVMSEGTCNSLPAMLMSSGIT